MDQLSGTIQVWWRPQVNRSGLEQADPANDVRATAGPLTQKWKRCPGSDWQNHCLKLRLTSPKFKSAGHRIIMLEDFGVAKRQTTAA